MFETFPLYVSNIGALGFKPIYSKEKRTKLNLSLVCQENVLSGGWGCLLLQLFPRLASRLPDGLFPTKSHERTVEQAREEVEFDVDVVHVERPSSRIAQRDGVLQAVGPAPVEGVVFLPHFTVVVAQQRFFALTAGIENNLMVDQRTVVQRIVGLPGVVAQLPRGGSASFGIVAFADGAAAPGNQQDEEAEEEGQVSFAFFHVVQAFGGLSMKWPKLQKENENTSSPAFFSADTGSGSAPDGSS